MQQMKMRIADRNASIIKEQFVSLDFNYQLYRTVKARVKVDLPNNQYCIERREWYDIILTTKANWSLKLKRYFEVLQNHNLISHFELI